MNQQQNSRESGAQNDAPKISVAEWAVAVLGALLVIVSLAFVVWEAATRSDEPPDITVRVDTIVPLTSGFVVKFNAKNSGDHTAADVQIEGTLQDEKNTLLEHSTASIDYLPPRSTRGGGLILQRDPRRYRLVLRALGYQLP